MSQPSVAAFFHSRKRAAVDDIFAAKNKITATSTTDQLANLATTGTNKGANKIFDSTSVPISEIHHESPQNADAPPKVASPFELQTRSGRRTPTPQQASAASTRPKRCLKRTTSDARKAAPSNTSVQPKIVKFTLAGHLSPKKKMISRDGSTPSGSCVNIFGPKESNVDRGLRTPTKEEQHARVAADKAAEVRNKLSLDDIKARITRSVRRPELLASLGRMNALEESRQKILNRKESKLVDKHSLSDQQSDRAARILGKSLKSFETIDLEVLSSPQKGMTTPTKQLPSSPGLAGTAHSELMSPKKTATPRRLFSPTKASPTKTPAHQAFAYLAEKGRPALQMPYKYRCLAEVFKCVDTVCAMFFNRHETITMKKLRPAVQRMLRKNFDETYLAQINHLFPEAYTFYQKKMLNAGSHTKYDYYQLVVVPKVQSKETTMSTKLNEDDIIRSGQQQTMNPQVIIERQQQFNRILLDVVKEEHDKFLRSLDPPMNIPKEKITHWHAEFDLQSCPDIKQSELPQPPNVEKFSSAKDILSTARNLFNCATPSERIMQRFEAKLQERASTAAKKTAGSANNIASDTESEPSTPTSVPLKPFENPVSAVLKGVPKNLLERIRAKQAAKALDAMTRRPSQDKEAGKYERLPELARYLRNIFVTESKSVLELDIVLSKIENSFRERVTKDGMKELLEIIGKEAPNEWLTFHHIRKTDFVKIKKDVPLNEVIQVLERKAADKAS